ncbi:hypothetical protein GA0111570_108118 [Raineyella antarctica]|uniref:Uncharacterized protein n=1 Tax=Raineyella antarctica TaxID=1577474 RepID=A0A1G6HCD1_9ACTN|nr:hypothetical protein [Raineyella antarctica]SDB91804.1 hypothetical protein GA0111570_108118 [Raineyella antarctica]
MANEPQSPLRDPRYDLIAVLEASLDMAWRVESSIKDAEEAGDAELAEWVRKIQHSNVKAGEQMLLQRLQKQSDWRPADQRPLEDPDPACDPKAMAGRRGRLFG